MQKGSRAGAEEDRDKTDQEDGQGTCCPHVDVAL